MAAPSKKDKPITPAEMVRTMKAYGIGTEDIAKVMGMSPTTLRKHYRTELDVAEAQINARVAGFLYENAENGNVTAQIFWLKTRARWRETAQAITHSGAVGTYDLTKVSDADLKRVEAILAAAVPDGGSNGAGEAGDGGEA